MLRNQFIKIWFFLFNPIFIALYSPVWCDGFWNWRLPSRQVNPPRLVRILKTEDLRLICYELIPHPYISIAEIPRSSNLVSTRLFYLQPFFLLNEIY